MLSIEISIASAALLDAVLQAYVLGFCYLRARLLKVALLADRQTGKSRPLVTQMQHFAHLLEKLRLRIVMPPAPAIAKFDEVLLPTLDNDEPSACDTVVRTFLPFRHEGNQAAVESALVDKKRAALIRATKMSAASNRLFVDFLFDDASSVQIDSMAII